MTIAALSLLALGPGLSGPARAVTALDPQDVCSAWASVAAAESGVPAALMHAIARVETGRASASGTAQMSPWPWTVNADGNGHWFDTSADALAFVHAAQARGVEQIDVGCFQINVKWHGHAFSSLDRMMDPGTNARYAARFLTHLHAEFGGWTQAAAAFHSRTPERGRAYVARLHNALASLPPATSESDAAHPTTQRDTPPIAPARTSVARDEAPAPGGVALGALTARGAAAASGGLLTRPGR